MNAKRAMSSDKASRVKIRGHVIEAKFATLIKGRVLEGEPNKKKDVKDVYGGTHSVKSGTWWQIFLYRRNRFIDNTDFQSTKISQIMINCLDAFPENREEYLNDKALCKLKLMPHMRELKNFLENKENLLKFFRKAFLNNGEVDYLTICPEYSDDEFHVFDGEEAMTILVNNLVVENTEGKGKNQFSAQKVTFRYVIKIGEIELRNDSETHYREMKFRINGPSTLSILKENTLQTQSSKDNIFLYGKAAQKNIV